MALLQCKAGVGPWKTVRMLRGAASRAIHSTCPGGFVQQPLLSRELPQTAAMCFGCLPDSVSLVSMHAKVALSVKLRYSRGDHRRLAPLPHPFSNPMALLQARSYRVLKDLCTFAAHIAALSIGGQDDSAMFGVFDGHGTPHQMHHTKALYQRQAVLHAMLMDNLLKPAVPRQQLL